MIKKIIVSVIKRAKSLVDEFRARTFGWELSVSLIGWVGGAITAAIYWLLGG